MASPIETAYWIVKIKKHTPKHTTKMARIDDLKKIARYLVIIINIMFLAFGIAILIAGLVAFNKASDLENNAEIYQSLNVKLIAAIIVCVGIATIVAASSGCLGAYFKNTACLKAYGIILFMIVCLQIAMGAYLISLNINDLQTVWDTDTQAGEDRRIAYQGYLKCCGWQYVTDSMPETPCNGQYEVSCSQATQNVMDQYMTPVALAVVIIGSLEVISLLGTCLIIASTQSKEDYWDNPFGY